MAICRTLGDHCLKGEDTGIIAEPYISEPVKVEVGDILLVASDGVSNGIETNDINNKSLVVGCYDRQTSRRGRKAFI
jgi:hypothetical protein